jgi:hypothetical protein
VIKTGFGGKSTPLNTSFTPLVAWFATSRERFRVRVLYDHRPRCFFLDQSDAFIERVRFSCHACRDSFLCDVF